MNWLSIMAKIINAQRELEFRKQEFAKEKERIERVLEGVPPDERHKAWREEFSELLFYFAEEVDAAECRVLIERASKFHLPVPSLGEKECWEESRLSYSKYLVPSERKKLQRALLAEERMESESKRARIGSWVGIGGLIVAAIALLRDVPLGNFLLDIIQELKK